MKILTVNLKNLLDKKARKVGKKFLHKVFNIGIFSFNLVNYSNLRIKENRTLVASLFKLVDEKKALQSFEELLNIYTVCKNTNHLHPIFPAYHNDEGGSIPSFT